MFLVIDGGTTNLRVTLLDEKQKPVDAVKEDGGVRHTAVDGNNQYLKTTLRACIDRLLARNGLGAGDVKKCVAYGMITSDMGLLEIPHVPGARVGGRSARRNADADLPGDRAVPGPFHPRRAQFRRTGRSG